MSVKVMLVDDHPIVRHGLRNLLESDPGIKVVAEAEDGISGLERLDLAKPDLLVVDLMMPGLNGLDVIKRARKKYPRLLIIVLSMQSADSYVVEALRAGANGFVLKDTAPGEIMEAIRTVQTGGRYISPALEYRVVDPVAGTRGVADPYETLTTREREILHLVIEGLTNPQMAKRLVISPRTVELHRSRMMKKLDLHNQTEIFRYAVARGIVPRER